MERAAHTGWVCRRDTSCASAAKSLTEIARKRAHFRTKHLYVIFRAVCDVARGLGHSWSWTLCAPGAWCPRHRLPTPMSEVSVPPQGFVCIV